MFKKSVRKFVIILLLINFLRRVGTLSKYGFEAFITIHNTGKKCQQMYALVRIASDEKRLWKIQVDVKIYLQQIRQYFTLCKISDEKIIQQKTNNGLGKIQVYV